MHPSPHKRIVTGEVDMKTQNCFALMLLLSPIACTLPGGNGGDHPCKQENKCLRDGDQNRCADGFQWEDPSDQDNFNCVPNEGQGGPGGDPVAQCTGCGADQVCVQGQCTDVPSSCPCPKETYCDLASNTCQIGCTTDTECDLGRICDSANRTCSDGCRSDATCPGGFICENESCVVGCRVHDDCSADQVCRGTTCEAGCREDGQCTSGQICDNTSCRTGCRQDSQCGSGQICVNTQCQTGCRQDAECGSGQVCNNTQCVTGCRDDDGCSGGTICIDGQCETGCRPTQNTCSGENGACCGDSLQCEGCCSDSDCGDGDVCEDDGSGVRQCRAGCRQDTDCTFTFHPYYENETWPAFDRQGYCSTANYQCYPPCVRDPSVQGNPSMCEGTCISPGRLVEGSHAGNDIEICVSDLSDPGFPSCDDPVVDADGICSATPSCPGDLVCHKTYNGGTYTLYPLPSLYKRCWRADLIAGRSTRGPCDLCGQEPYMACGSGHCRENNSGVYRCEDWCGNEDICDE
jgi:hypothetical protein